ITHFKKWNDCAADIARFYEVCRQGLQEKLGWVLFQMPPSFAYSEEKLRSIAENLDASFKNAIEFRHGSWWREDAKQELEKHNGIFCTPSYPKLREDVQISNGTAYIRLHGRPNLFHSGYTDEELLGFLKQASEAETAVFYFNNTASQAGI